MPKRKLLDLFCGAGGAGMGYKLAGFKVTGVDLSPMPRYPFKFIQADALQYVTEHGHEYDVIHASPPCQAHSAMRTAHNAKVHKSLVAPTRKVLRAVGLPYVIENVIGAPLENPIILCGSMFGLGALEWQLQRHRQFETNMNLYAPEACSHTQPTIGIYGGHVRCRSTGYWRESGADFPGYNKKQLAQAAMGIDWMTMNEMSQAIPPAYTQWIGSLI